MSSYTSHIPPPCQEEVIVRFADDDLLVVEKPAGLLTVPGRFVKDCVLQRMMFDFPDVVVLHRLDLDTSGLVVMSQSKRATRELNRQFREREVSKEYLATVFGEVKKVKGEIDLALRPDPDDRPRQVVDEQEGKPALTSYKLLQIIKGNSQLSLIPVTGRSHQLRVHLASVGHPILGCDLYAHKEAFAAADRLMLHASRLSFKHPTTKERMSFFSDAPF
jgi:tRNA pseudouridine32 synthase/23S rRNA pseudouridine746 synthase